MNLSDYIKHPEKLDKETLPRLEKLVGDYPYFQPARLLYLRNLYLLHDAAFDRELRRAAFFLPDRKALFRLIEGVNYRFEPVKKYQTKAEKAGEVEEDRTYSLIDNFLANLPEEKPHRPKPVDASTDYMAYLVMDGGQCAGYFSYGAASHGGYKDFSFCLNSLYLLPPYQHMGLGRRIFAQVRQAARERKLDSFFCGCNVHNLPARRFYEKMGGVVGEIDDGHENLAENQMYFEFCTGEQI